MRSAADARTAANAPRTELSRRIAASGIVLAMIVAPIWLLSVPHGSKPVAVLGLAAWGMAAVWMALDSFRIAVEALPDAHVNVHLVQLVLFGLSAINVAVVIMVLSKAGTGTPLLR